MAGGVILVTVQSLLRQPIKPVHSAIIGATLGVAVALHATVLVMLRSMESVIRTRRCCPQCGEPGATDGSCRACGAAVPASTWIQSGVRTIGGVPDRHWVAVGLVPVMMAAITLVVTLGTFVLLGVRRIPVLAALPRPRGSGGRVAQPGGSMPARASSAWPAAMICVVRCLNPAWAGAANAPSRFAPIRSVPRARKADA
jgi:hypothetical protein